MKCCNIFQIKRNSNFKSYDKLPIFSRESLYKFIKEKCKKKNILCKKVRKTNTR